MEGTVPVAALLLLYFNGTVEYITPVVKDAYRSRQPLSFLIYNAMLEAASDGYKIWNWGGTWSLQKSLHHFKEGWGAVELPYTYLISIRKDCVTRGKNNFEELRAAFPFYYIVPEREVGM
jgi:Uncharacterized protein involved in methicillin resistance